MTGRTVTARAHPNIALVKYWGKRDEAWHLPVTGSLSITLDVFVTVTGVTVDDDLPADRVELGGAPATPEFTARVTGFLDLVRELAGSPAPARVTTVNHGPTGAGLASSASGFAALAVAAAAAYGVELDPRALSRLARRGSGSAARSIHGGFVHWHRGEGQGAQGDPSSYAEPVPAGRFDPAMVIAVVDAKTKSIDSRAAMRRTVDTSPLYRPWAESSERDLREMRAAVERGDLTAVGEIAERNAWGMHATMLAARPAVRYLAPGSIAVLDRVLALRADGVEAYATMDAGPNVKVLCDRGDTATVARALSGTEPAPAVVVAGIGPGAEVIR